MFSLRYKLIIGLTLLIIFTMGLSALLFYREMQQGMIRDTFASTSQYAAFTADSVSDAYDLYWTQKNYLSFNRIAAELLAKHPVVVNLSVYRYDGEFMYDYAIEKTSAYSGPRRQETEKMTIERIQSKFLSSKFTDGSVVFFKSEQGSALQAVDSAGQPIDFEASKRVENFMMPSRDRFAVLYDVSYAAFDNDLRSLQYRIAALAAFAILLGVFFSVLFSSRIIASIRKLVDGAAVLSKGDFGARVDIKTGDELEVLGKSFNTMAEEIDKNTKLMVYKERVTKELELAAKIQTEILPKKIPVFAGLDISAGIIPAEEVGGDCYDFLEVDKNRMIFYLGDATGHGVPAGILVSVANALFYYFSQKLDLLPIMVEANSVLKAKSANNMFMTLACLEWNEAKKTLRYVNAGHEPLIIFHAKDKSVEEIRGGGMALGMLPDNSKIIKETPVRLDVGDTLVIYSDGLPECWKDEKECYGMDRLKKLVGDYGTMPSALAIRNGILSEIKQYSGGYKQMDDMTIIVVKRKS